MYGRHPVRMLLPEEQLGPRRGARRKAGRTPRRDRGGSGARGGAGAEGEPFDAAAMVAPGLDSESLGEVGGDAVGSRWKRGAPGEDDGTGEVFAGRPRGRGRGSVAPDDEELLDDEATALFEALRAHRMQVARAESVPPYVVASDRTLRDIARRRPTTLDALQEVHGIGPGKAERFGAGLLRVVQGLTSADG
jgi:superfamily II DNA helicase RecQ